MYALVTVLALVLQPSAEVRKTIDAADAQASGAAHAQNVEAFAVSDIKKAVPTTIAASSARQLADPAFRLLANQLGDSLRRQGFNMVRTGDPYRNVITLDYRVNRDIHGDLPNQQQPSDPREGIALGLAAFPVYRRLTVIAYAMGGKQPAQVLWRTVMAEDGFEFAVGKTIPSLVDSGREYYGRNLTQLAVADCNDFAPPLGSHIPMRPCGEVRANLNEGVVRRPQVTVGPLAPGNH